LGSEFKGRDIETIALDFTDFVRGDILADPEEAVRRLISPEGVLFGALARRGEAEMVFRRRKPVSDLPNSINSPFLTACLIRYAVKRCRACFLPKSRHQR
jgi:hypothetical protein